MSKKDEFIPIFKAEAEELVTKLDKGIVELEKYPGNTELAKELNMVAHTLKGASRVFGFNEIQEITHKIEDILEKVSQKRLVFDSLIAGRIFRGLDGIRAVLAAIIKGEKIEIDLPRICLDLEECLLGAGGHKQKTKGEIPRETDSEQRNQDDGDEYIRIPLSRVNKLLRLTGEMVINKMKSSAKITRMKRLDRFAGEAQRKIISLGEAVKTEFDRESDKVAKLLGQCNSEMQRVREETLHLCDDITVESFHIDPVIDEIQASMKEMRMLPLFTIFEGFPRMVRDIASAQSKEVTIEISGEKIELDKKVLEKVKAPLIHILRNCVDHGIEDPKTRSSLGKPPRGTIRLAACHDAGNVVIRVEDDGKGVDIAEIKETALKKNLILKDELEKMNEDEVKNIVFMNGYSTSPMITDISGRGMGLDIARRGVEDLKGRIILDTEKDKGTRFTLVLPLTIAVMRVLLVKSAGMLFAVPMTSVNETIKIDPKDISTIEGKTAVEVRGHIVPLVRLNEVLELPAGPEEKDKKAKSAEGVTVIIASSLEKRVGFIVDRVVGEEEVFIKGLGGHLGKINNVSGATMLWTGEVVVVLNVEDLLCNSCLTHPAITGRKPLPAETKKEKKILIVEDALSTRELEKHILENEGYAVDTAVDGMDAMNKIAQVKYDLIISDIEMPRLDGFQLCEALKKDIKHKDIPVIIVTAMEKEEYKRRGLEAGAAAYITKTAFDQLVFLDAVERLIG